MSMIALAIRRPVTVAMFTLALLVFGMILLERLGMNLLPELSYPTLTVHTEFPGSAPGEVENLISIPLEGRLSTINGLRQVRSVSRAGSSDVYLEFHWGTNMDLASLDVREQMDQVNLPLEVDPPTLLRFNPDNDPVMRLSFNYVGGEAREGDQALAALRREADLRVTRFLETVDGVAAARASGGLEDEVQVLVDQTTMAQLGLSIDEVAQRLRAQNVNLSAGQIISGEQQLLVRTFNEYTSVEDIAETVVLSRDQRVVRLRDIAEVRMGHRDPTAVTRHNGEQAVEIAIYREGDANIVQVAQAVKDRIAEIEPLLQADMRLTVLSDSSLFIEQAISELLVAGLLGGLLAMMVIYLFLGDIRPTIIISLTIPISVIITFNFMYMSGIDMNIMSLGGLALAIGMLVDNAIVVLENIARKKEEGGALTEAAEQGAREVGGAITASTLTTIAVFLPLVFVEGIAGQLFRDQALTIAWSLLVSLFVALTLIPMMASRAPRVLAVDGTDDTTRQPLAIWHSPKTPWHLPLSVAGFLARLFTVVLPFVLVLMVKAVFGLLTMAGRAVFYPLRRSFEILFSAIARAYSNVLPRALAFPVLTVLVAFTVLGLSLLVLRGMPTTVLPDMAQGQLTVKVEYAPGSAIEVTDARVMGLSQQILALDGVEEVFATAGSGNRLVANPQDEGENRAEIILLLRDGLNRTDEDRILRQVRELLARQTTLISGSAERPQLFTFDTPLSIQLYGFDLDVLRDLSTEVLSRLSHSDTFLDVDTNMRSGYPEAQVVFDQYRLAQLNVNMQQASSAVINAIRGNTATRFRLRDEQIDVLVRLQDDARRDVADLHDLIINPGSSRPVPLSAVADVNLAIGPNEIVRIDQQRVAIINAQILGTDLGAATQEAQALLADMAIPPGVMVRYAGQSEEMERSFNSLMFALALAIFLVYLVMASQFESLLHPFIILLSVPLALVGAIFALFVTGTELSVIVFLGLIMLAGIVVNNAIVLVDRINQLRQQGMAQFEAIIDAARSRLRPILMTTMTTTLAMLPLAMGVGEGAEIRAPLAITVIGGLLLSTLLTLLVIPVMYRLLDRKVYILTDDDSGAVDDMTDVMAER